MFSSHTPKNQPFSPEGVKRGGGARHLKNIIIIIYIFLNCPFPSPRDRFLFFTSVGGSTPRANNRLVSPVALLPLIG